MLGAICFDPEDSLATSAAHRSRPAISQAADTMEASTPARAEALHRVGLAHQNAGHLEEARTAYEGVLALAPKATVTRSNLGNVLLAQGKAEEAIAAHRIALAHDPLYAAGWANLALALEHSDKPAAAVAAARRAVELAPGNPEFHYTAGTIELAAGAANAAVESFIAALRGNPRHGKALLNLAVALKELGAADAADTTLETLIALEPDNADAHFNIAVNLLSQGELARGFAAYEWRLRLPGVRPRLPDTPRWDGNPRLDAILLLIAEQGLGDTFQFVRFARRARARVGRVVAAVHPSLVDIAKTFTGVDEAVPLDGPIPRHDLHVPMMSLPFALGIATEEDLSEPAWLAPEPERVRRWREWLDATVPASRLRVGIGWRGNPSYRKDSSRSLALARFEPLARVPGVALVSLQKGPGEDELAALAPELPITVPSALDSEGAFTDSAALLSALDLVVASDSALVHVAGALARPTWVLLSHRPDWRWGASETTTPWYPAATLMRQTSAGDWDSVFARAASALAGLIGAKT